LSKPSSKSFLGSKLKISSGVLSLKIFKSSGIIPFAKDELELAFDFVVVRAAFSPGDTLEF